MRNKLIIVRRACDDWDGAFADWPDDSAQFYRDCQNGRIWKGPREEMNWARTSGDEKRRRGWRCEPNLRRITSLGALLGYSDNVISAKRRPDQLLVLI